MSVIALLVSRLEKDSHLTELARKLALDIGKQVCATQAACQKGGTAAALLLAQKAACQPHRVGRCCWDQSSSALWCRATAAAAVAG